MFTPPFTVHSGDDPNNSGQPIIDTQHGTHPTLPAADAEARGLPQDKFWEIRDSTGAVVSKGHSPIVHPPRKKGSTTKRSKVVKPKTVQPKWSKKITPKKKKPK